VQRWSFSKKSGRFSSTKVSQKLGFWSKAAASGGQNNNKWITTTTLEKKRRFTQIKLSEIAN